ncbi:hypothetical protein [Alkalimonas sp.]|uniref:hypothetical protein n=1 Tax=Alkalimonas sp. TaxID=1872453 RepID=UPI00263B61AE|nr:hypothetical protein [Alkalimonas sp.]MCC5825575.1 hypothetical protein [Alkalimonas sp.]
MQLQRSSSQDGELQFHYRWQQQGQTVDFSFQLPEQSVQQHLSSFRRYSPQLANTLMRQALQQELGRRNTAGMQVELPPTGSPFPLKVKARRAADARELQQQLTAQLQQARQDYLHQIYHTELRLQPNRQVIMVDHQRILADSLQDLLPVAAALQQKFPYTTTREISQFLLDWLQRIPYQSLNERSQSSAAGFLPPLQLIQQHRGDCDSKVVLMAALLRLLLPDVPLVIVYLPNHAVLGIGMQSQSSDQQLRLDGQNFVLADPTGPALQPVGEITARYQLYLQPGIANYRRL